MQSYRRYNDYYPYSSITVSNGNKHEIVFDNSYQKYYDDLLDFDDEEDDLEDALLLLYLLSELED